MVAPCHTEAAKLGCIGRSLLELCACPPNPRPEARSSGAVTAHDAVHTQTRYDSSRLCVCSGVRSIDGSHIKRCKM